MLPQVSLSSLVHTFSKHRIEAWPEAKRKLEERFDTFTDIGERTWPSGPRSLQIMKEFRAWYEAQMNPRPPPVVVRASELARAAPSSSSTGSSSSAAEVFAPIRVGDTEPVHLHGAQHHAVSVAECSLVNPTMVDNARRDMAARAERTRRREEFEDAEEEAFQVAEEKRRKAAAFDTT